MAYEALIGVCAFLPLFLREIVLFSFDKSRKAGASGFSMGFVGVLLELLGVRTCGKSGGTASGAEVPIAGAIGGIAVLDGS